MALLRTKSPIPVKFLIVQPGTRFAFRILLRPSFDNDFSKNTKALRQAARSALERALTQEGLGAKTALGLGRFTDLQDSEPSQLVDWERDIEIERFSWKKYLFKVQDCQNWGKLRQLLLQSEMLELQQDINIAQAVKDKALEIRKGASETNGSQSTTRS